MIRILVVDDDLDMRVLVSTLIQQLWKGVDLEVAAGGREALQKLNGRRFDVVLTDIQMPELDGYATAEAIRRMPPPQCHTKIICMSGGEIQAEKIRQCGIDACLMKPFSIEDLRLKLSEIVASPIWTRED